jgi:hypothetical protein
MRRSSAAPAGDKPGPTARSAGGLLLLGLAVGVLGTAGCRSPRLGGTGDTCGRTDDCEAPLRCVQAVCRDPAARVGEPAAVEAAPRPPTVRGALPPLSDPPRTPLPVGAPPAGNGGVDPTRPMPVPDEPAVPAAGLPGQH